MDDDLSLRDLLGRARAGDEQAAADLARRLESALARCIRVWLRDPRIRRQFDTVDVCQSVLLNFFLRLELGQFELNSSEDLLKLLRKMARNKFLNLIEHAQARKRDDRRNVAQTALDLERAGAGSSPSFHLTVEELAEKARACLDDDERRLVELRKLERTWEEIGTELKLSPEAARKRHKRAVERATKILGLP
jgi:RNA polymerase sigma-70 factor (ECF subfamily)